MIQRIQSVYLLLAAIFSGLCFTGNIVKFSDNPGNILAVRPISLVRITGNTLIEHIEKLFPLTVLLIVIPIVSITTIFLYKNRKRQKILTSGLIALIILLIITLIYYSVTILHNYNVTFSPGIIMLFPVFMLIFTYLAYRGIRKDEELVRSCDRLR
jgi:cytochrome c biogenesis factor